MITFQGNNVEVLRIFRTPKGRYIIQRPHEKDKKLKRIELKSFLLSVWIPFELKKPKEIVTHVRKKKKIKKETYEEGVKRGKRQGWLFKKSPPYSQKNMDIYFQYHLISKRKKKYVK